MMKVVRAAGGRPDARCHKGGAVGPVSGSTMIGRPRVANIPRIRAGSRRGRRRSRIRRIFVLAMSCTCGERLRNGLPREPESWDREIATLEEVVR